MNELDFFRIKEIKVSDGCFPRTGMDTEVTLHGKITYGEYACLVQAYHNGEPVDVETFSNGNVHLLYPETLILNVNNLQPERVIFNNPATIVYWSDKTKTVVKCSDNDIYDPEKGFAIACSKKLFGNNSNFNNIFRRFLNGY